MTSSGESNPATSREVGADCLFTLNSLRKTKVSNVRERQRLELRLRILDSEERFETSKINIFSKSVRKRLDVLQSRMTEYNKRRESQLKLLGGGGDGKESVESTRRKSLALKIMKMEDEVIPSLKKLIAFAMKNPETEEEPEEDEDGSGNNTTQESGGDGTNDKPDAAEVRGSNETDKGTQFGTDDLKALVDRLYENCEREYETDAIIKRLRPIIGRQAEAAEASTPAGAAAVVATTMAGKSQTMNQPQQPQQIQQPQQQVTNVGFSFFQELSLNEDDGIVTLNKMLSLEFPETSIQQQIGLLTFVQNITWRRVAR